MARNSSQAARVRGAKELRETLKALGDRELLAKLSKDNQRIGEMIVRHAQGLADAGRESIVASQLKALRSNKSVSIRLPEEIDVNDKRGPRPVGMGTEFGAHRNRRRLVKNTGGRHTIVRDNEDINKVIRRVENQTRLGYDTVPKRAREKWGATAVKVTKIVKGWNTFRPWRGNGNRAGYFWFPAIRRNRDLAIELYIESIEDVWSQRKGAS